MNPLVVQSGTSADGVATALREGIFTGEYLAGQALPQDELAAHFGVSKIPMREALVRLQAEGLVVMNANRGAQVTGLTAADVSEIYDMRIALETLALRRAVPAMTRADVVRADGLITIMDDAHDALQWSRLNWEFHHMLYAPSGMTRLIEVVRALHANVTRYHVVFLKGVSYHAKAQKQHRVILKACKAGDADAACTLLATHMREAAHKISEFLTARDTLEVGLLPNLKGVAGIKK